MTLPQRLAAVTGATVTEAYDMVTAEVSAARWVETVQAARDELGLDLFDLLTVVDQLPGGFEVVVRLWSVAGKWAVVLRTSLPRDAPVVDSLVTVYAGAAWHERHAAEMFGVRFTGHPDLAPLLLGPASPATPLRKDVPLTRRGERPWPGAQDPAHSGPGGRPPRRLLRPPGSL